MAERVRIYTVVEEHYDNCNLVGYLIYRSFTEKDKALDYAKACGTNSRLADDPWFAYLGNEAEFMTYGNSWGCMVGNREIRYVVKSPSLN